MTRLTSSLTAITIVSILVLFGCGFNKSPSDVVKVTYMAANSGQYSEVEKHLSKGALSAVNGSLGASSGGLKGIWDKKTRNGTIEKMELQGERIRGEQAAVDITIHFKDGRTMDEGVVLIKEDGDWKLTLNIL